MGELLQEECDTSAVQEHQTGMQNTAEPGVDRLPDSLLHLADYIQGQCELEVGPKVTVDEHVGTDCHSKGWNAGALCVSVEACDSTRDVQQSMF